MARNAIAKSSAIALLRVTRRWARRGDCDRDENGLKEADELGCGPNHECDDGDEQNHEEGGQRGPHHFALPGRRVSAVGSRGHSLG